MVLWTDRKTITKLNYPMKNEKKKNEKRINNFMIRYKLIDYGIYVNNQQLDIENDGEENNWIHVYLRTLVSQYFENDEKHDRF